MKRIDRRQFINTGLVTGLMLRSGLTRALAEDVTGTVDTCPTPAAVDAKEPVYGEPLIEDEHIAVHLTITPTRVLLKSLRNKKNGFEFLSAPTQLFRLTADSTISCAADGDLVVDSVHEPTPAPGVHIVGHMRATPVTFFLVIEPGKGDGMVRMKLRLRNDGLSTVKVRAVVPELKGLVRESHGKSLMAAVPQEAAGVVRFNDKVELGMQRNPAIGLPIAMNVMEVVSIYDHDRGGGLFVLDAEGDLDRDLAPLQMQLTGDTLSGSWATDLLRTSEQELPAFVIGVHDTGDWHTAVDRYTAYHRPEWKFPEIPAWFRDQGALYSFSGSGAGAIYMDYPQQDLNKRIASFHEIPKLLDESKSLGTNIVYLWDYWEGAGEGDHPRYWNKGDYFARKDLGGADALREGIRRLHEQGGRVIFYIEWYIIYWYSEISKKHGEEWAARDLEGNPNRSYPENYALVPASLPWQDYIVGIATMLMRDFAIDGIYLDSMGWQLNWPSTTLIDHRAFTSKEFSRGALELTDRVRRAVKAIKPDGIVMGETTSGALPHHWDGGLSADFAWLRHQNQGKVLGSPARYAIPEINVFSNGHDRNEMNQIYAAGYSLALTNVHLPEAPYIRSLVEIRQKYKDALIHGAQMYQPGTGDDDVIAYYYRGADHDLVTVVNIADRPYRGALELRSSAQNESWLHVLGGSGTVVLQQDRLPMTMEPKSLHVLVRQRTRS